MTDSDEAYRNNWYKALRGELSLKDFKAFKQAYFERCRPDGARVISPKKLFPHYRNKLEITLNQSDLHKIDSIEIGGRRIRFT